MKAARFKGMKPLFGLSRAAVAPLFLVLGTLFTLGLFIPLTGCDDSTSRPNDDAGVDADADGEVPDADADGGDDSGVPECVVAGGTASETGSWVDGANSASVFINGEACDRAFALSTTQFLRDSNPANPRTFGDHSGGPIVSTNNAMFDALYALALEEMQECSVAAITDGAYNNGSPIDCPAGGCFETGRLWKFVWTRDTSYAVELGMAALDPVRAKNSMEFKLSELRSGGDPQIIQDTGSGGSYPVSTDRVVWAMGARQLLKFLDGTQRQEFLDNAWAAVQNTLEQDREVVYSPEEGLYLGEQSFLDWREQTYPAWTATDTVQIHMSQALSTNVGHLALMEFGAQLALEKGESVLAAKYQGWADDLRSAIDTILYHPDYALWGTFTPGFLDRAPVRHFDLLGTAMAVLHDVGDETKRADAVAAYPHLNQGPPVIWPQQKEIPIYHNRGIWPFVTAYWLKAARKVRNDAAVNHNVHSLMRGAALNLSNMENFECVTGLPWVDDGSYSGPVVNSQRQLWSVAGYLSMVHDIIFGMEASSEGIRFLPYVTRALRTNLFGTADSLVLNNFPYKGHEITVVVHLPAVTADTSGAYSVGEVSLNGVPFGTGYLATDDLGTRNLLEITLVDTPEAAGSITLQSDTSDYRTLFAPLTPSVTSVTNTAGQIVLSLDTGGEAGAEIGLNIYRDGVLVAEGLPGTTATWTDDTTDPQVESPCYTVESYFLATGASGKFNVSQHAKPNCYWGDSYERITLFSAGDFSASGGTLVNNYGYDHYESWGAPGDTLEVVAFTPTYTGNHLIQVLAGNGAGSYSTGITCVTKLVEVYEGTTLIGSGHLVMPHLGTWDDWRDSNFVEVPMEAGVTYRVVISQGEFDINMSDFEHNALYGGTGGASGAHHYVNIAQIKLLSRSGTP